MLQFNLDFKALSGWLNTQPKLSKKAALKALYKVAEAIEADSKRIAPGIEGGSTKQLIDSWKVEEKGELNLQAGYDIVYAMYQHQGRRADGSHIIRQRPAGGQSFYLKRPIDANFKRYINIYEREFFKAMKWI